MNQSDYRNQLEASEYASYFQQYIDYVGSDVMSEQESQIGELQNLLSSVTESIANTIHPPYGWTIKQVIGHLIDNEKVFGYRALRFAAGDQTQLNGYDQNAFVENIDYSNCALSQLVAEFESLRRANLLMFQRLGETAWKKIGIADGKPISVRAIAHLNVGHVTHHLRIIRQRLEQPEVRA